MDVIDHLSWAPAVELLRERGWHLAVAESLTGGLLAARIAETPDTGEIFAGGLVAYHGEVKRGLLGVPDGPVISAACAEAMARGVAQLFGVEVAVAVTGVAGPASQEGQPVGLVFGACSIAGRVTSRCWRLDPGDPHAVRIAAVDAALGHLQEQLRTQIVDDEDESALRTRTSRPGARQPPAADPTPTCQRGE